MKTYMVVIAYVVYDFASGTEQKGSYTTYESAKNSQVALRDGIARFALTNPYADITQVNVEEKKV